MTRERSAGSYHVYLALTIDGSYYCGYAVDADARIAVHNAGRGAKILRGKRPVRLAYRRTFSTRSAAARFESALKKCSHAHKYALSRRWLARVRKSDAPLID
jgi:putative endonuclease